MDLVLPPIKIYNILLYKECYGMVIDVKSFSKEYTNDAWNPEKAKEDITNK